MAGSPSESSPDPDRDLDPDCIFCLIASGRDEEAEVLSKGEELVCFKDLVPAAPHHYLVVPRDHIQSCCSLNRGHVGLVSRMAELGREVLRAQGVTNMADIRLGFHRPPFTSVDHLHLHVLAPASQILAHLSHKFVPGSARFVTERRLQKDLQGVPQPHFCLFSCFSVPQPAALEPDGQPP